MAFHNFLILRTGAIGDVIHTLPFIKILANSFKHKKITYAMSPYLAPLMKYVNGIDEILEFNLHTGPKGLWQQACHFNQINEFPRFSDLINLQPHWKTKFFSAFLKTQRKFIYSKNKKANSQYHAWEDFALSYFHPQDSNFKDFCLIDNLPLIKLPLNLIIEKTQQISFVHQTIVFILGVGKHRPHRAWPLKNWLQLLKLIDNQKPMSIILLGGEDEKDLAQEFMANLPPLNKIKLINLVGQLDLLGTAAILSKCYLAVGADTGPTHLAAALGIYTIGLFGPTSALRHAPFKGIALKSSSTCALSCNQKKCTRKVLNCMESLIPEQVWFAINNYSQRFN